MQPRGHVLVAVNGKTVDRLVDFSAAFLDLRRSAISSSVNSSRYVRVREPAFDALDLGGNLGRKFRPAAAAGARIAP